jgi:hypothetical protein
MHINWLNLSTVGSAGIMVGTMIFGLAYATGWALGGILGLGDLGAYFFEALFFVIASVGLIAFLRAAVRADPILEPRDQPASAASEVAPIPDSQDQPAI